MFSDLVALKLAKQSRRWSKRFLDWFVEGLRKSLIEVCSMLIAWWMGRTSWQAQKLDKSNGQIVCNDKSLMIQNNGMSAFIENLLSARSERTDKIRLIIFQVIFLNLRPLKWISPLNEIDLKSIWQDNLIKIRWKATRTKKPFQAKRSGIENWFRFV